MRRTAQLAVFVVLGAGVGLLIAPLAAPSAHADSQTGIDVLVDGEARHVELHEDQYDTGPTNYTLRSHDDQSKVTLSGVSLAQFIRLAGADPDASKTNLVQVRRNDGSWVNLGPSDFADDSFREGPALFSEDAGTASFFRPVRDRDDLNAHDYVTAAAGTALLVRISSPGYLYVDAAADPEAVQIRHVVTFTSVAYGALEGEHLTYTWHFGDDTNVEGPDASHRYDVEGEYKAWVGVVGDQDSRGHSRNIVITVTVDKPSPSPSPSPSPEPEPDGLFVAHDDGVADGIADGLSVALDESVPVAHGNGLRVAHGNGIADPHVFDVYATAVHPSSSLFASVLASLLPPVLTQADAQGEPPGIPHALADPGRHRAEPGGRLGVPRGRSGRHPGPVHRAPPAPHHGAGIGVRRVVRGRLLR